MKFNHPLEALRHHVTGAIERGEAVAIVAKELEPKTIKSRDGSEVGTATGKTKPCAMEGCAGTRIGVRWPDGRITWPCSRGIVNGQIR